MDAAPFRAVRYDPVVAGDPATTSAPAYDDVERFAYAEHRTASPYTVLELFTPRAAGGYAASGSTLERWWRTGVLVRDPGEAFYLYEEHELRAGAPAVQRGVLAAVRLEPLDASGALLPHEAVDPARVAARMQRLLSTPLEVSPVFAVCQDTEPGLRALLDRPPRRPPVVALTDEDGVDHRVWRLDEPADVEVVRRGLAASSAVIADGHHRYASALSYRDRRRAETGGIDPAAPWERTLTYVVDATVHGPRVAPIHRLMRALPPAALRRLDADFVLEPAPAHPRGLLAALGAAGGRVYGLRLPGRSCLLRARDDAALRARLPAGHSERWRGLDAAVFEHAVVPALGVERGAVVACTDVPAAWEEVDAGRARGLFLLRAVDLATVLALAVGGELMPPKTTSFRPKPRTGLIMRALAP